MSPSGAVAAEAGVEAPSPPPAAAGGRKRKRPVASLSVEFACPCCYRPGRRFCEGFSAEDAVAKLRGLRALMAAHGADAYVVGSEDAHGSEYVAAADERLAFLTGFTGSAGTAVVTASQALLWTDSRYFLQAAEQLKGTEWILMQQFQPGVPDLPEWLLEHLRGRRVGVDPALLPAETADAWRAVWGAEVALVEIMGGLVDPLWRTRPEDPCRPIQVHPAALAGESVRSKLQRVRAAVAERGAGALLLSALDQIAWLFNIRGADIECNPVVFAYAVVAEGGAWIFLRALDAGGLSGEVAAHLQEAGVVARPYGAFFAEAPALLDGRRTVVEPATCSLAVLSLVPAERRVAGTSPVETFKAQKNEAEVEGLRRASARDSAAVCEFFAQLEERLAKGVETTEVDAAELIGRLRARQELCVGDSFPTISAAGPNSAVVHYRPEPGSCGRLGPSQVYLCDTGGQYRDGTTDITRTVHFGTPSAEERECYTRVAQGHIGLASAVFPEETPGIMLDMLARQPLWRHGMNYGHGTGHGMGAYLNVHEGPLGISGGSTPASTISKNERLKRRLLEPFLAGHFVSDEPGCYLAGKFGIRIESDLLVVPAETAFNMGSRRWLRFDCLTLVPFCRSLLDVALLERREIEWLDSYHRRVWEALEGSLGGAAREWLRRETLPLATA